MSATLFLILRFLIAAALYTFLGWVVVILWRDLRAHTAQITLNKAPRLGLRFTMNDAAPVRYFTSSLVTIGRDAVCDCPIDDRTVSTRHARLSFHHTQWWLDDLGSTNGTMLNGEPVTEAVVLTSGDLIRCGQVELRVEIQSPLAV